MTVFAWTFPGGKQVQLYAAAVAGNVVTPVVIGTGKRVIPLNIVVTLTTDATGGNRYATVTLRNIDDKTKFKCASVVTIANATAVELFFNPAFQVSGAVFNALSDAIMEGGEDIVIHIEGGLVGDAYDVLVEYLEVDE